MAVSYFGVCFLIFSNDTSHKKNAKLITSKTCARRRTNTTDRHRVAFCNSPPPWAPLRTSLTPPTTTGKPVLHMRLPRIITGLCFVAAGEKMVVLLPSAGAFRVFSAIGSLCGSQVTCNDVFYGLLAALEGSTIAASENTECFFRTKKNFETHFVCASRRHYKDTSPSCCFVHYFDACEWRMECIIRSRQAIFHSRKFTPLFLSKTVSSLSGTLCLVPL